MKKRKLFKKGFVTISIILGAVFIGNLSLNFGISNIFKKNVVEAVDIVDTLGIMLDNNPINVLINREIKLIEEEKAKEALEKKRIEMAKKLEIEEQEKFDQGNNSEDSEDKRKTDGKIAYLTFDDGPSLTVTPRILDILDEYDIKATFFVIGRMAEKHPEMLQRIYQKGHSIGNHSYSHNYSYIYKNTSNFIGEINKTNDILKDVLGEDFDSKLIRFPGGSFGKDGKFIKAAVDAGYKYYDWNSLNGDAEGKRFSKDRLIKRFKDTSKNKKKLIVLMHDTDAKDTTADALSDIIEYLINQGYEFDKLENYE
ncbi:polysaccharide deacetylase family protein [Paratissierella segnis]|jgi:peptidoglycan/xylan/chitin deacetylase (PgdA/CDA1 family)|uniref:Polysaccharide deacetylase n=1 Tax=Paratissierella segnis TaxID=2763679 RepID=A0A926EW82_9FIRM|nr:polysaccharide deacetylase family protein [Paratissierella segnis]MBC8588741.1 polysaccharide deacetylase [Paratissierella segnis]